MVEALTLAPAILSALSTNAVCSNENSPSQRQNDDACSETEVVFQTEDVLPGTVCYVEPKTAFALSKVGWDVKPSIDINGLYYYVTSPEMPKVVGATIANTDLSALLGRVSRIQGDVIAGKIVAVPDPNPTNINNAVLGYLRSFNKNYAAGLDQIWDFFAQAKNGGDSSHQEVESEAIGSAFLATSGKVNALYTRSQDLVLYDWNFLYKYFCSFVDSTNWPDTYHNAYADASGKQELFPDPVPTGCGWGVDLIHLFASIDGGYAFTQTDTADLLIGNFFTTPLSVDMCRHLTSWAGDLQQIVATCKDELPEGDENPAGVLFNYGASREDLLADVDAVNITTNYLTGVGFLSDAIHDYYGATQTNLKRFKTFRACFENVQKFENTVYSYLGLENKNGVVQNSSSYENHVPYTNPKYIIMDAANFTGAGNAFEKRKKVAEAFITYVELNGMI